MAAAPPPRPPPQPAYSSCMLSGSAIVELSSTVTLLKRSRIGARALSEPIIILVALQYSSFKNVASFGVKRCSIAWGVTSTPISTAICAVLHGMLEDYARTLRQTSEPTIVQ